MKFGKTLLSHQIPEWSIYYMNYKHLKKIIKSIDEASDFEDDKIADLISNTLSEFFFELDRDIEKVDEFYNNKYKEYERRLSKIVSVLGFSDNKITRQIESNDDLDEIISILLELRTIYRNLKWFGELNHKGFFKILKKLDKKLLYLQKSYNNRLAIGEAPIQLPNYNKETYLSTRVNALPFVNKGELLGGLDTINNILNELGEIQISNDSLTDQLDFLKIGNRRYSLDQEFLKQFDKVIENDDFSNIGNELSKITPNKLNLRFLISLLSKACLSNSLNCIEYLLNYLIEYNQNQNLPVVNSLFDQYDISGRNFFHQFIVSLGKSQVANENKRNLLLPGESSKITRLYGNKGGPDGIQLNPIRIDGIQYIMNKIDSEDFEFKKLIIARDNYSRTPLHYAAQYGLKDISQILLNYLNKWSLIDKNVPIDDLHYWGDQEGLTPIHLSIIGKHPKTTDNLIIYSSNQGLTCPNLLLLSVRLNCLEISKNLIKKSKINVDYTDLQHNNETALYIAAKLNYADIVEFLLQEDADTEICEALFGWTPIFIAASEGFKDIVNLLIDYGCKIDTVDYSGWFPMEHASLRGHLAVADLLKPQNEQLLLHDIYNPSNNLERLSNASLKSPSTVYSNNSKDELALSASSIDKLPEPNKVAVNEVYKQLKHLDSNGTSNGRVSPRSRSPANRKKFKPIKSFGHRYLNLGESLLLITLGTTDLRDNDPPIELNNISMAKSFFTELDTALSLCITCRDRNDSLNELIEPPTIIDLPLEDHHGSATDPLTFKLTDNLSPNDVIVTFDIIPTYQYPNSKDLSGITPNKKHQKVLGRAMAFLNDVYTNVGPNLRSLNNKISVPIFESNTLDLLGKVRFEYLCVKPFSHPSMNITRSDTYWKQLVSTRVIGHRGLGKNVSNRNSLQLGENTVESFIAAASLGASYVEFDVQLTKDFTAVIYHDFTVAESGVDIPMHALTAEQFLSLSEVEDHHIKNEKNKKSVKTDSKQTQYSLDDEILGKVNRPRSMSTYPSAPNFNRISHDDSDEFDDEIDKEFKDQISRRMKLTKTWKDKGFKGNARGLSIASNFVTLKELFKKLPKNVGFNIELKYPMLDEAESESMGEIAFDMNFYVDTILKVVFDENTNNRDILFSSFHPDICLLLSLKQPTMPILYLTEAGTQPMADIRASSLQNAIRFAKKWNLLGIVSAAKTLVKTPRLAQVVKSSGLVCVTYGIENNSPEYAKIQMKAGVDAVIADSVLAVREGLRKDQESFKEVEESLESP